MQTSLNCVIFYIISLFETPLLLYTNYIINSMENSNTIASILSVSKSQFLDWILILSGQDLVCHRSMPQGKESGVIEVCELLDYF